MPQAKSTDGLSNAGQVAMMRGFAAGWTALRVAQAVKDETGEEVTPRTVARRAAEWRAEVARRRSARERMQDMVAAMKAEHPEALTGADPIEMQRLSLESERTRLKRREMDLRERTIAVQEKKLAVLEEREKRVIAALTGEATVKTPEERNAEIREIYGLPS
jgi:hypothetical protein